MKRILLTLAILIMATASVLAQVPTVMMYQVKVTHGKAAAQDVTIQLQLRKSQGGSAIWCQSFDLKDVKNGSVHNLGLEFGDDIDWNDGEYWLATIVDGEEKGCAKMTSVPYAFVAKKVEGVITRDELIGTWKGCSDGDEGCTMTFKEDGTFDYKSYDDGELEEEGGGKWDINGAGMLYYRYQETNNKWGDDNDAEEKAAPTFFLRNAGKLVLGGGDNFYGDELTLSKNGSGSQDDDEVEYPIINDNQQAWLIGGWEGTVIEEGYEDEPVTVIFGISSNGTYTMKIVESGASFTGSWHVTDYTIYLTNNPYQKITFKFYDDALILFGDTWSGTFKKTTR